MAFPSVASQVGSIVTSNSTTWVLTYPGGIQAGDILLAFFGFDGSADITTMTDWTDGIDVSQGTAALRSRWRIADGTESGNFNVSISAAEQGCWLIVVVRSGDTALPYYQATGATGDSTSPDPPNLAPGAGAQDFLWLAIASSDHGNTTYTGKDANFTYVTGSPQESGGANGAALAVAYRELNASSLDPGAFTTDAGEGWNAMTLAMPPAPVVDTSPHRRFPSVVGQAMNRAGNWFKRHDGLLVPERRIWAPRPS